MIIMGFFFRFDEPRKHQDTMIDEIYKSLEEEKSILVNAPTGVGKTDAALSAALSFMLNNPDKRLNIFFLTPKISQHQIALDVLRGLKEKYGLELNYVDFIGKRSLCTNEKINTIENDIFYHMCKREVDNKQCASYKNIKEKIENGMFDSVDLNAILGGNNTLFNYAFNHGLCAYELTSHYAKHSSIIVASYPHLLNPNISAPFLAKVNKTIERSILIWDEAHNIIDNASSYLSSKMSMAIINNAKKELEIINKKFDLDYLEFELNKMLRKLGDKKEILVDKDENNELVLSDIVLESISNYAIEFIKNTKAKRSSLMHIYNFLNLWKSEDDSLIRIASINDEHQLKLQVQCLYPEEALKIFGDAYSNIFMSATLIPLEMYKELFRIDNANIKSFESPFPKENKIVLIDDNYSTKFVDRSIEEYKRIANRISEIKRSIDGNVAVFFPSFEVLNSVFRYIGKEMVFRQQRNMNNKAIELLIKDFKKSNSSLLFGVMGGSLSEGVDYPNNIIKGIIIVGVPVQKPDLITGAKIKYYNRLFNGKGEDYVYTIPALIKVIQAAGRAVRSEKDNVAIILMDRRYNNNKLQKILRHAFSISKENDLISAIETFYRKEKIKVI